MPQKGPGKWFRKGISLVEVVRLFPDDPTAEEWFAAMRWPDGPQCPHCASRNVLSGAAHPCMPYRCRGCDKRFSVRTGSVMADSKLGYQVWAVAIYLLTTGLKGVSSMKLHRDLGISQKSTGHLAHRIRRSWEPRQGPARASCKASCAGRWRRARSCTPTRRRPMPGWRSSRTRRSSTRRASTRGQAHVNGLESFRALLKRGYHGTYHHMSPQHLQRYVTEFAGRHNNRCADTAEQMRRMVHGLLGKTLTYRQLTGKTAAAC